MAQMAAVPSRASVTARASSSRGASAGRAASAPFFGNARKALMASAIGATAAVASGVTVTRAFFGGNSAGSVNGSAHDFTVTDIDGKSVDMSTYKGKALLIVNVASA